MEDRKPEAALIKGVDLVVTRFDQDLSVLSGRCHHRGALLADGYVSGNNLICGLHGWDYRIDTGASEYNNEESLYKFPAYLEEDNICVLDSEIVHFLKSIPSLFNAINIWEPMLILIPNQRNLIPDTFRSCRDMG